MAATVVNYLTGVTDVSVSSVPTGLTWCDAWTSVNDASVEPPLGSGESSPLSWTSGGWLVLEYSVVADVVSVAGTVATAPFVGEALCSMVTGAVDICRWCGPSCPV